MAKTVLIIEDNSLNMKLFSDLLENSGYNVLQAMDGLKGFELAKRQHPDLVIVDIRLPEISGFDIAKMIKADNDIAGTPIIAVTAYNVNEVKKACLAGSCDDYVEKPILPAVFLDTVEKNVSSANAAPVGQPAGH